MTEMYLTFAVLASVALVFFLQRRESAKRREERRRLGIKD